MPIGVHVSRRPVPPAVWVGRIRLFQCSSCQKLLFRRNLLGARVAQAETNPTSPPWKQMPTCRGATDRHQRARLPELLGKPEPD
jgi:hypothetical protein